MSKHGERDRVPAGPGRKRRRSPGAEHRSADIGRSLAANGANRCCCHSVTARRALACQPAPAGWGYRSEGQDLRRAARKQRVCGLPLAGAGRASIRYSSGLTVAVRSRTDSMRGLRPPAGSSGDAAGGRVPDARIQRRRVGLETLRSYAAPSYACGQVAVVLLHARHCWSRLRQSLEECVYFQSEVA